MAVPRTEFNTSETKPLISAGGHTEALSSTHLKR
jgi:hypothetical protein